MISGGVVAIRQLISVQLLVTYLKARLNKSYSTYCMMSNVTFYNYFYCLQTVS